MKNITAYIRLANEENTILPCLESIKNIFDSILIIHSDITDSSLDLIKKYCIDNNITNLYIQKYPFSVIPPHSIEYKDGNFLKENSLASYYNFGLQFINTEFLMKIDADQIYINEYLNHIVSTVKIEAKNNIYIGLKGYNCIINDNNLYSHKQQPYNGGYDHFIIETKYANFVQTKYWEQLKLLKNIPCKLDNSKYYWFHLKKGYRYNNIFVSGDKYSENCLSKFDSDMIEKYKKYILPILIKTNSPYKDINYA